MKKTLFSIAIAAMAIFSTATVSAQKPADKNTCPTEKTCTKPDCKKQKCDKQKCDKQKCDKQNRQFCAFEGLNLTADQQAALKAIPTPRESMKALFEMNKQKADTSKARRQELRQAALDIRKNYLTQIQQVLTPEQYTKFLENYYVVNQPQAKGFDKGGKRKDFRPGKDGKGPKADGRKFKKDGKNRRK